MASPAKRERIQVRHAVQDYQPESLSYYNPDTSQAIVGNSVKGRMHVNLGSPNKNRALGRTQSLPDAFASTSQTIWRNAADDLAIAQEEIMQASQFQADRELRPMFATLSTPASPTPSLGWSSFSGSPMKRDTSSELASIQHEEVDLPTLSDFGDRFEMDVDEQHQTAEPVIRSAYSMPASSPTMRRKRKISVESEDSATDEEMDLALESQSTLASLNQHFNRQLRQPTTKRALRATQSLPVDVFGP